MQKSRFALRAVTFLGVALAFTSVLHAQMHGWTMAISIVDSSVELVFFEKMDATQLGSIQLSMAKARSAVLFKRPTKAYEDALAAGGIGVRVLKVPDAIPVEGGVPLIENGKIIGAVGVSGGQSTQDGQCANAAAALVH